MRVIKLFWAFLATLMFAAAAYATAPAASGPLVIKVIVGTYVDPVKFTLDQKYSCEAHEIGGNAGMCIFTKDCGQFPRLKCVPVALRPGRHLVKADYGNGSISEWAIVGTVKSPDGSLRNGVECLFSETMGSARLFLECDDPIRADD